MNRLLRPLRVRLAIAGFVAVYAPVLALLAAVVVTEVDATINTDGVEVVEESSGQPPAVFVTAIALIPVAALLAWWWSGRAVRPIREAVQQQERLIEETSHELRTPLSILATNAEVLLEHPDPSIELYRQGLERSGAVAQRMTDTIESLLVDARGRARTIDRRPTDLVDLAARAVSELQPLAAERRVTLDLPSPPGEAVRARVDQPSVERALANLLTNAIDHAPPGSVVGIEIDTADGFVEIAVTDLGPGIAAGEQARVFDRYWQGDATDPGGPADAAERPIGRSGIGLAIVRQVAMAHGGTVGLESPVAGERGTRFRLRLAR